MEGRARAPTSASMTREEFFQFPAIMSYFPLTFTSGQQKWTEFSLCCNDCKKVIPTDRTRGEVAKVYEGGYRTVRVAYEVTARGLCPDCNRLTFARYTLHSDMTLTGYHPETGEMSTWKARKRTTWNRILDWFRGEHALPIFHFSADRDPAVPPLDNSSKRD